MNGDDAVLTGFKRAAFTSGLPLEEGDGRWSSARLARGVGREMGRGGDRETLGSLGKMRQRTHRQ